jgi:hypothetical protein
MKEFIELTQRKNAAPVLIAVDAIVSIKGLFSAAKRNEALGTTIEFFGSTLEVTEPYDDVKDALTADEVPAREESQP